MKVLNIGIVAHIDAGKTTLTENLLFESGVIKKKGRVDSANTVTDNLELEKKRGITIKESTVSFRWRDCKINLLDTPGHSDFYSEVVRSLQVLDMAILVVSAKEGVQAQTYQIVRALKQCGIPFCIFINKIDRIGADVNAVENEIVNSLNVSVFKMQSLRLDNPKEQYLIESWDLNKSVFEENLLSVASFDKNILEAYGEDDSVQVTEILETVKRLFWEKKIVPVYYGSAINGIGIIELLNGVSDFSKECSDKNVLDEENLSAHVYKVSIDNTGTRNVFLRVFDGSIKVCQKVHISNTDKEIVIRNLFGIEGSRLVRSESIGKDDIAVIKNENTLQLGDYIGYEWQGFYIPEKIKPLISTSIVPVNGIDRSKLISALQRMNEENPDLNLTIDSTTSEVMVNLLGTVQLEYILDQLGNAYGVMAESKKSTTILKETIACKMEDMIDMWDETNPYYASIQLEISPLERGSGVRYESKVSYGYLTKSFQTAVYDGVLKGLSRGIHGNEITDVKVVFTSAYYDSVSSTPADFRNLAPYVVEKILQNGGTYVLIPLVIFEISLPSGNCGKILYDIEKMGGKISEIDDSNGIQIIRGEAPYDNCKEYGIQLASYTQGKGVFSTIEIKYVREKDGL